MGITISSYRRLGRFAFTQVGPTTQVRLAPIGCLTYVMPHYVAPFLAAGVDASSISEEYIDLRRFTFLLRHERVFALSFGYGPKTNTLVVRGEAA